MKGLKITRLKLTEAASAQLDALKLSLADLVSVIRFARKMQDGEAQTYRFDIEQVPASVKGEFEQLVGVELRVVSGAIVSATRLAISEMNARDCLPSADCETREEKP